MTKKGVKLYLYKLFKINYCDCCLSTRVEYGYWSRAHDMIYGGAHGNQGHRCVECGYIKWKTPLEVYRTWYNEDQWKIYEDSPRYKNGELILK